MYKTVGVLFVAICSLSACSVSDPDPTNSAFSTPNSAGAIGIVNAAGRRAGSDTSTTTGNVYGYEVGSVTDEGLQGFAGIATGATVTAPPGSGPASYTGTFEVGLIDFIIVNGTSVSGQTALDFGTITLNANFDTGEINGAGTGQNNPTNFLLNGNSLVIDGDISGSTLTGTATYDGVSGPLQGLVGSNEVIGAFHGHTDGQVHAGGFIAN